MILQLFNLEQVVRSANNNSNSKRQVVTTGLTKNNSIDLAQSGPNRTASLALGSSGSAPCKQAPDLNNTLRSMIKMKNNQKRQHDTDI